MKLKIGIIGYSQTGKRYYNELRHSKYFEICGVFDPKCEDEFCRAPFFRGFNEFVTTAKPDAIVLCVSQEELVDTFNKCIKFCQNILIADPNFKNSNEIKDLRYIAGVNKTRVCVGFSERFAPVILSLKRALAKEEEIYSVYVSHLQDGEVDIVRDVGLAKILIDSQILEFSYSSANFLNQKTADNIAVKFKGKNKILACVCSSASSAVERFCVEVSAKSGVYFGDLLNHRLYQLNQDGQVNLKIDTDKSDIKSQYEAFYELCSGENSADLISLDELIKLKELFA